MNENAEIQECNFYNNAKDYWSEIPATIDGMLGGYGHVSQIDVQSSRHFLKQIFQGKNAPGKERALDCGAGIGRITKDLLSTIFDTVDLAEQNPIFLEQAKVHLAATSQKIGEYYPVGLQDFQPLDNKYDVIWCQWVLGHLTDEDLVNFFKKCMPALKENGIIVVKENITSSGECEKDEKDSSVTRTFKLFMDIFDQAELKCLRKLKQPRFPKELYTVYMFALKPKT